MSARKGATYSAARIAARMAELGREISRACEGRPLDVIVRMDRGFIFAADLIRQISATTVCHFERMFVTWITMVTRGAKFCLARHRS